MVLPRVHIIGVGNVGKFIAHSLARAQKADVTLLFHRQETLERFENEEKTISLDTDPPGEGPVAQSGFGAEGFPFKGGEIRSLIVATKAQDTVGALESVIARLTGASDVLVVQNGYGECCSVTFFRLRHTAANLEP